MTVAAALIAQRSHLSTIHALLMLQASPNYS